MSGFPVNGKFGLFHRFEAEKSKKNGKPAFTVKFLTVIKEKVKISAVKAKESVSKTDMMYENKKAGAYTMPPPLYRILSERCFL